MKSYNSITIKATQSEIDNNALVGLPVGISVIMPDNEVRVIDKSGNAQAVQTAGNSPLNNFAATTTPTSTNNFAAGFAVGSRWIDITNDESYICTGDGEWSRTTVGTITEVAGLQTALDAKATTTNLISHTGNISNPHSVTKAQVGLGLAENTTDLLKPISTATQSALDAKSATIHNHDTAYTVIAHGTNVSNPHSVTKTQVGLGSVDNTTDIAKPVSTTQQTALDLKVDKVIGKQLSTNDYTTAEQSKLAGVAAGAEVNIQPDYNQATITADDFIKNKPDLTLKEDKVNKRTTFQTTPTDTAYASEKLVKDSLDGKENDITSAFTRTDLYTAFSIGVTSAGTIEMPFGPANLRTPSMFLIGLWDISHDGTHAWNLSLLSGRTLSGTVIVNGGGVISPGSGKIDLYGVTSGTIYGTDTTAFTGGATNRTIIINNVIIPQNEYLALRIIFTGNGKIDAIGAVNLTMR